jgi:hypothetical protein
MERAAQKKLHVAPLVRQEREIRELLRRGRYRNVTHFIDVLLRRRETSLWKNSVVRCTEVYTVFRDALVERVARCPKLAWRRSIAPLAYTLLSQ